MANYPRYAIYYAPQPGSVLDCFGTELLGYDAHRGIDVPFPAGMEPPDWHELTQDPRRYGFHATLKPPMSLLPDQNEEELVAACAGFASKQRKIPVIKPVIEIISGFIAIVPAPASADVERLAADCVRDFERFRAPLTEEHRGRRNPSKLTPKQLEYLDRWGYPYVFEEFRFHMTLTGRLALNQRERTLAMLRERFSSLNIVALAIDRIALFRQIAAEARFQIMGDWPLTTSTRVSKTREP